MRFCYEGDEPELAQACHELERLQIYEADWRASRRRASLAIAILAIPLLLALLAVALVYLSRAQVSGIAVFAVCLVGGLMGGLMIALRGLGAWAFRRQLPATWPSGVAMTLTLPLLAGAVGGTASAALFAARNGNGSYRPQTLYLIALAAAFALIRVSRVTASFSFLGPGRE
jgi:hypothetical protein